MKTIKQIADELGVNKQKVYRFIVKNHITASSEVKQSKLYDEAAERLIKSHFDRITTSCERSSEPHQKSGNEMLLEQLIKELAETCGVSEQAIRKWCARNQVAKDVAQRYIIDKTRPFGLTALTYNV